VKILPAAGAVAVAGSWFVAVALRSCFAAVAAHWLVAGAAVVVVWELELVAAVDAVVWELELVAAVDAVVWELELVAAVDAVVWELGLVAAVAVVWELVLVAAVDAVVWELGLAAAGAVAVVSVVEPVAAFQAWLVAAVGQVWPFPVVSLALRGPVLRFRKVVIERLRL
jgi:hypothetical protein